MNPLGILGFGRFGQLLYKHLKNRVDLAVYDPYQRYQRKFSRVPFVELSRIARMPHLILAVPVAAIEEVARKLNPHIRSDALVMDVCAVKTYPLQVLEKELPSTVEIVGSHPLFGPDSAADSFRNHILILSPVRIAAPRFQMVRRFWQALGVQIVEMTPAEQDRLMAWSLALTHFLGRALTRLPLPETPVSTRDYQNLLKLVAKINRDTVELFQDMHRFNPYTREMREVLYKSIADLKSELDSIQKVE